MQNTDCMSYFEGMEITKDDDIMRAVLTALESFDAGSYTKKDVEAVLMKDSINLSDYKCLLSEAAKPYIEEMARKAKRERNRYFGTNVNLFTPLYISNYCENYCVYCGFNSHNKIKRMQLDTEQVEEELKSIASSGLQEILILTGESPKYSDIEYIGKACKLARKYFKLIGVEIYPLNEEGYAYLNSCGVDFVTVFQETYNTKKYASLHLGGNKRSFVYRFNAQERALKGGMRGVGLGALLGLDDFRKDAFACAYHALLLQKKYPHAEISLSCPRLRPIKNGKGIEGESISETELLQVICAYRLFLPYAGITVSSRESARFRDGAVNIAATKISAGVDTGIGRHSKKEEKKGDEQFMIADSGSVAEVCERINKLGMQPVMNDYINLT